MKRLGVGSILAIVVSTLCWATNVNAQPSKFTYQGRLTNGGTPVNGSANLDFRLYSAASGGTLIAGPDAHVGVPVSDGLFTVQIDFGSPGDVFDGGPLWLQIHVNGTALTPRQEITAAPYSLFSALPWETSGNDISYMAGRVGIGTDTPAAALEVAGTPGVDGIMFPDGTIQTSASGPLGGPWQSNGSDVWYGGGGVGIIGASSPFPTGMGVFLEGGSPTHANIFAFNYNTLQTLPLVLNSPGGNVGIGTTNPTSKLTVNALGYGMVQVNGVVEVGSYASSNAGWYGTKSNHPLYFFTNNSLAQVALDTFGNLGVGTSSPARRLHAFATDLFVARFESSNTSASATEFRNSSSNATWEYSVAGSAGALGLPAGSAYFYKQGNGVPTISMRPDNTTQVNGRFKCNILDVLGADIAEKFPSSDDAVEPGTVMEIDPEHPGQLRVSREAYCTRVAGVVSGAGDLSAGAVLGNLEESENGPAIALSGRVWVRCDASTGAIAPGDLLTTADMPGHAMKAADRDRSHGAVLGKAMTALADGEAGLVLVLVNLQ